MYDISGWFVVCCLALGLACDLVWYSVMLVAVSRFGCCDLVNASSLLVWLCICSLLICLVCLVWVLRCCLVVFCGLLLD